MHNTKRRKLVRDEAEFTSDTTSNGECKNLTTFCLLITLLIVYDLVAFPDEPVNFQAIKTDLYNNVCNQNQTIRLLVESLNRIQSETHILNVVSFVGSTGVGKTHVANILKRRFYPSVFDLREPFSYVSYDLIKQIESGWSRHKLVVIDDLTVSDVENLLVFIKNLSEETAALVICIFNIQETDPLLNHSINYDAVNKIVESFDGANVLHSIARFNEFSRDDARAWIVKRLFEKGVNAEKHDKIVDLVLNKENTKYHGLKGLHTKINLIV